MSPLTTARRQARAAGTPGEMNLAFLALLAVAVLVATLLTVVPDDAAHVVETGEHIPLDGALYNGEVHEVLVPGARVTLQVGQPVEELDSALVDLSDIEDEPSRSGDPVLAAHGTALVPVSWQVRPMFGTGQDIRSTPITVRLVSEDGSVELARGSSDELTTPDGRTNLPFSLVGVPAEGQLSVEVEFDGATQTLDVETGELDTGLAEGLYDPAAVIEPGCERYGDRCHFTAEEPDARWRVEASDSTITTGDVTISVYDTELGWAPEGHRWATTSVRTSTVSGAVDRADGYRRVEGTSDLEITLDGAQPRRTSGLGKANALGSQAGVAVFEIEAGSRPRELTVAHELTLEGDESPRTLPMRAAIPLDDAS